MPLPSFNAEGVLPNGVHHATEAEVRERLVDSFPTSASRQPIFEGFCRYRVDLSGLGLNVTQWVDGSFTDATRLDPDDIDLVNYVSADEVNAIPAPDRARAVALLNGRENTKATYSSHTFLETVFPAGHPFEPLFENRRVYWRKWFAIPQDYSKPPNKTPAPHRGAKGIVSMTVGTTPSAPKINTNP
jgi:hypothetical protein